MTDLEKEQHWLEYTSAIAEAQQAERQHHYARVVELAAKSWPHIEGMLQHTRCEASSAGVELDGILLVLFYAPLVFDVEALNRLEEWLNADRRVVKVSSTDPVEGLAQARATLRSAHALWDHLERHGQCDFASIEERFSSDGFDWQQAVATWRSMEIVRCTTNNGAAFVRLGAWADERITAKCPSCGTVAPLARTVVLNETPCPRCSCPGVFVMVSKT